MNNVRLKRELRPLPPELVTFSTNCFVSGILEVSSLFIAQVHLISHFFFWFVLPNKFILF